MIKAIASDFQAAAAGKNSCHQTEYDVRQGIAKPRWLPNALEPYLPSMFPRDGVPALYQETVTWCSTLEYAEINYYDANWRSHPNAGPDAGLKVNLNFHASDPGTAVLCDFAEAAVALLTVVAPEILPADIALEEGIQILCDFEAEKSSFSVSALAS